MSFTGAFKRDKAAWSSQRGQGRRQCIAAATCAKTAGIAQCNGSFRRECVPCCDGGDPVACGLRVCGDGQQTAAEECEPPGAASCDEHCLIITTTRSTVAASSSTVPTTTPTTSTSTTTTILYTGHDVGIDGSPLPNGTSFVAGDQPVVEIYLADDAGLPISLADPSIANLYMYGPQDESVTTTALTLLRASGNRTARPHHYIDLKTNPDVVVNANVLSHPLNAVTNEAPRTYTVAVWAVLKAEGLQQWMPEADCQIGMSAVETQIAGADKCASYHLGAASGRFYLHHIDPGLSPTGNWALDAAPVRTCKACPPYPRDPE